MFPLIAILTVLICAIPLCLAIGFLIFSSGAPLDLAVAWGILLFVVATGFIIHGLILRNARKQQGQA